MFAWGDKYDITDDQETPVFRVEGEVFTFGAKLHLYDLKGQELYYVEQEDVYKRQAIHIPNAKSMPLTVPNTMAAKLLFFMQNTS